MSSSYNDSMPAEYRKKILALQRSHEQELLRLNTRHATALEENTRRMTSKHAKENSELKQQLNESKMQIQYLQSQLSDREKTFAFHQREMDKRDVALQKAHTATADAEREAHILQKDNEYLKNCLSTASIAANHSLQKDKIIEDQAQMIEDLKRLNPTWSQMRDLDPASNISAKQAKAAKVEAKRLTKEEEKARYEEEKRLARVAKEDKRDMEAADKKRIAAEWVKNGEDKDPTQIIKETQLRYDQDRARVEKLEREVEYDRQRQRAMDAAFDNLSTRAQVGKPDKTYTKAATQPSNGLEAERRRAEMEGSKEDDKKPTLFAKLVRNKK